MQEFAVAQRDACAAWYFDSKANAARKVLPHVDDGDTGLGLRDPSW